MNEPKPWLKLSPDEHAIARMLKERHGLKWPFAAIIARDVVALRVVDGSLSLPLDPNGQKLRKRPINAGRYNKQEAEAALEDFRRGA
jgi:hypothetical protein